MIKEILSYAIENHASDVILASGNLPAIKQFWEIVYLDEYDVLSNKILSNELKNIMSEEQKASLQKKWEIDFSYEISEIGRFRVNIFSQNLGLSLVFRVISPEIPKKEELWLPLHITDLLEKKSGIILVTGGVGSGKSTTLASLIKHINLHYSRHIITLEDPIEYFHESQNSLVEQREVGKNTQNFENGLMYALRQASDVIMIGEMRDLETFRLALRAAETGNLVLATVHTAWAARTIARIIDMFPGEEKNHIRTQLAESLIAVLWQDLLPAKEGGRVLSSELLIKTKAIENMIRESVVHQINGAIETGKDFGMISMKHSLEKLLEEEKISQEVFERYMNLYGISQDS